MIGPECMTIGKGSACQTVKVPKKETMRRGEKEGWEKKRVELEKGGDGNNVLGRSERGGQEKGRVFLSCLGLTVCVLGWMACRNCLTAHRG